MNWTRLIFILIILSVAVLGLIFYWPVLAYLLISVVLSYILDPIVTWCEYKRVPRWLSSLLLFVVIGGLLAWLAITYVPHLVQQGNQVFTLISQSDQPLKQTILELPVVSSLHDLIQRLDQSVPQLDILSRFEGLIATGIDKVGELPDVLMKNYQSILGTVALMLTIPIFSFFLLRDRQKLRRAVISLVPNKYFELALILLNKVDENVGNYLRAIFIEMISVAIMSTIALSIVGVPYAMVIGVIAGIMNIIPYIGPWMGGIIAAIVILVVGLPPYMIIWMGLAMFLVQNLDNYIFYPMIVGKTIRMHPLVVLLTVFAGSYFGGVIWMLISVPLVYMTYSLVRALQVNLKEFRII
jgi:predicted PurR-regulated permease PerM